MPQRETLAAIVHHEHPAIDQRTRYYLRDVVDHLFRINDAIELYRDMIAGAADTYISRVSQRTNDVIKVLSIIATIMLPLSFLAGLYGMNFEYLPGTRSRWGFPVMVAAMATSPSCPPPSGGAAGSAASWERAAGQVSGPARRRPDRTWPEPRRDRGHKPGRIRAFRPGSGPVIRSFPVTPFRCGSMIRDRLPERRGRSPCGRLTVVNPHDITGQGLDGPPGHDPRMGGAGVTVRQDPVPTSGSAPEGAQSGPRGRPRLSTVLT
jgi:hypothetical protein